jgi:tetratricopeptide (TPR) repeat protein
MKKTLAVVLFMVLTVPLVMGQYSTAPQYQTPQPYASNTPPSNSGISVEVRSLYFDVTSDSGSYDAEGLLRELELRFEVYNRLFRFNAAALSSPLKVRSISDKNEYDRYVMQRLGSARDGAVYLHYQQADRRELVINRGSAEESRMLPHQAFIQYFRAFVSQPPTWMREGFAIYFNTLRFDKAARELRYEENLAWLETVKNLGTRAPNLETVFLADLRGQPEFLQPVSWALVSFFLNASSGNNEYFRTLTESFMLLSDQRTAGENAQSVLDRLLRWTNIEQMSADYNKYISSRRTFAELVTEGQMAYSAKDYMSASSYFQAAIYQKPTHYAPYYYLGLIYYENHDFANAELYYSMAVNYDGDPAVLNYALGVNAASAGRSADAINYLEMAIAANPSRYQEKAEKIINGLSP